MRVKKDLFNRCVTVIVLAVVALPVMASGYSINKSPHVKKAPHVNKPPLVIPLSYVTMLSFGPTWEHAGETQTLDLEPGLQKTYTADERTYAMFAGGLFFGVQRNLNPTLQGQLGLEVAAATAATVNGDIWEDADRDFNNYNYHYNINHTRVGLRGRLLVDIEYDVMPYVSASVAVAFNDAHGFGIDPKIAEEVPAPSFDSNTEVAFAYTLGFGLQRIVNRHIQMGVGYEFADWGRSELGRVPGQTVGHGPALSHLYTNGLQFNLSYIG